MEKLTTEQKNAVVEYATADEATRSVLVKVFGEKLFKPQLTIIDKVDGLPAAMKIVKPDKEELRLLSYKGKNPRLINNRHHLACLIIAEALKQGKTVDFSNSSETKYTAYMKHKQGFGLSYNVCGSAYTGTCVGSRLSFLDSNTAIHFGKLKEVEAYFNS